MSASCVIVAVDGPSGSGKGTACRRLARQFGFAYLDSGAIYRLVGLAALQQKMGFEDSESIAALAKDMQVRFDHGDAQEVWLNDQPVGQSLRTEQTADAASRVAAMPRVREAVLQLQRDFAQPPGLVADGRDMGTVVFPKAPLKFFLTASAEERARRRYQQLRQSGESAKMADLLRDIQKRDERDRNRAVAPLKPAADAHVLDSTDLNIDQVVAFIADHIANWLRRNN